MPLGAFLFLHLWINARAMQGELRYDGVVRRIQTLPGLPVFEAAFIALPLFFHAGYGIWTMRAAEPVRPRSPHHPPWAVPLQRATGLVTLAFVSYHLAGLRIQVLLGKIQPSDFYPVLTDTLGATTSFGVPASAVLYLVGLGAVSYHLSGGLMGFCFTWGLTLTERRHRIARFVSTAIGITLFLLGARTIVYFATGAAVPKFGLGALPAGLLG
jgi:succinate dehydrogenase/fumarate reductase cytochrome b subunit (b558 family)